MREDNVNVCNRDCSGLNPVWQKKEKRKKKSHKKWHFKHSALPHFQFWHLHSCASFIFEWTTRDDQRGKKRRMILSLIVKWEEGFHGKQLLLGLATISQRGASRSTLSFSDCDEMSAAIATTKNNPSSLPPFLVFRWWKEMQEKSRLLSFKRLIVTQQILQLKLDLERKTNQLCCSLIARRWTTNCIKLPFKASSLFLDFWWLRT